MIEQQDEASPLTLVSDEPVIPGISRFEQLCLQLIRQFRAPLIQRYPSGRLTVLIQTTTTDKEREQAFFARLWEDEALPWTPTIHVLPDDCRITTGINVCQRHIPLC